VRLPGPAVSTPTLAGFLAARLDEDEGAARSAGAGTWSAAGGDLYDGTDPHTRNAIGETWEWERDYGEWPAAAAHIARHDPARVLREIEAKRAILAAYVAAKAAAPSADHRKPMSYWYELEEGIKVGIADGLEIAVKHDAAVWSDHPDYRAEWKP
jgi:Family of unknown function (DUF6221)